MSYDVHIVRTEDWLNAADDPITKDEVDALISADSELAWSSEDWFDESDDDGKILRYFAILWNGEPCFFWYQNAIRCAVPSEDQLAKMIEIAIKFDANVLGDDGEEYH